MSDPTVEREVATTKFWPDWPILIWMILITLGIGVFAGFSSGEIISTFNTGWGYAAGEFALILLPSFVLAAAIDQQRVEIPQTVSVGLAPVVGAGMICPDTAYAALSPMVREKKLSLAFGAYAGFKLLFPAGPLIIATSLGVADAGLLAYCLLIFVPVWVAGLGYSWIIESRLAPKTQNREGLQIGASIAMLAPFALLAALLAGGAVFDLSFNPLIDFATNPKGALMITAAAALSMVPRAERRNCIDGGIRRTGSLLLIIGAASAFSAFVTAVIPVEQIFTPQSGAVALVSLFCMTAVFKLLQGSSMSTFAAAGPVAVPIVAASEVSPVAAVIAICLGSFVAILPNDSFYWLVRRSALADESEFNATMILSTGAVLQALVGLSVLLGFHLFILS